VGLLLREEKGKRGNGREGKEGGGEGRKGKEEREGGEGNLAYTTFRMLCRHWFVIHATL